MPTIEQARAWYADADPVHDFDHVMRVYRLAERLAQEEGADLEIVRAAALLHDAEGSAPNAEDRPNHHHQSAAFAGEILTAEGWPGEKIASVQHCIRAHRFRGDGELPDTIEARVIFDADKLDVLGAIGAVRVVATRPSTDSRFTQNHQSSFFETGKEEPGEPHSAYHEYLFKLRKIKDRLHTNTARAIAEERDRYLAEFFSRLGLEMIGEQ